MNLRRSDHSHWRLPKSGFGCIFRCTCKFPSRSPRGLPHVNTRRGANAPDHHAPHRRGPPGDRRDPHRRRPHAPRRDHVLGRLAPAGALGGKAPRITALVDATRKAIAEKAMADNRPRMPILSCSGAADAQVTLDQSGPSPRAAVGAADPLCELAIQPGPPIMTISSQQIDDVIVLSCTRSPQCCILFARRRVPLKVGIFDDIVAALGDQLDRKLLAGVPRAGP